MSDEPTLTIWQRIMYPRKQCQAILLALKRMELARGRMEGVMDDIDAERMERQKRAARQAIASPPTRRQTT